MRDGNRTMDIGHFQVCGAIQVLFVTRPFFQTPDKLLNKNSRNSIVQAITHLVSEGYPIKFLLISGTILIVEHIFPTVS